MRMKQWAIGVCSVLTLGMAVSSPLTAQAAQIPEGVYVGEHSLGGMTKEEASKTINDYVSSLSNQSITLDISGEKVGTTAAELGFHWSNQDAVDQAALAISEGDIIERYMSMKDLQVENLMIPLETAIDDEKVASFVQEKCSGLTAEPKNATITRAEGKFVVTPSEVGKTVDIEATRTALNQALEQGLDNPIEVTAAVAEAQPTITADQLSSIQDVLGTFTTSFSSSGASRSTNLKVGSAKINGSVLMPGEVLSGYECMQPFTTKNGYATAASYENGMVVDSVGGGVCQIATTLYNTVLRAELDVVQRQNHSMVVGYVSHSADAAIAGTYKDLKFKNNYSTPIYVEGSTSDRKLTFTVYGKETRPSNRTVKYVSETLGVTDPGAPVTRVDNSLRPGARVQEQSSHRGVRSRLWKVVTVDGQETERTLLHTDTYNASPAVVRVGPAAAAAPVTQPDAPVQPQTPTETAPAPAETSPPPVTGPAGGPGVSGPGAGDSGAAGPGAVGQGEAAGPGA